MKNLARSGVFVLLVACGSARPIATDGDASGSAGTGSTDTLPETSSTAASGGSGAGTGPEPRVAYASRYEYDTTGTHTLNIDKLHLDEGFCTRLGFAFPRTENSGERGIEYPTGQEWAFTVAMVRADETCAYTGASNEADVIEASGTVWWDDSLCFVDVDVTLVLPPDPRWPETDVLRAEAIPVENRDDCPGTDPGGTGDTGSTASTGG